VELGKEPKSEPDSENGLGIGAGAGIGAETGAGAEEGAGADPVPDPKIPRAKLVPIPHPNPLNNPCVIDDPIDGLCI
jgi:hypothetical protein